MSELLVSPKVLGEKVAGAVRLPSITALRGTQSADGASYWVGHALYVFVAGDSTPDDGTYSIAPNQGSGRWRKIAPDLRRRP